MRTHIPIQIALVFLSRQVFGQLPRPEGVPAVLACSAPTGEVYSMGVGNASPETLNYFLLTADCKEEAKGTIPTGQTQFVSAQPGQSWYARDLRGNVINTFQVPPSRGAWVIQVTIPPGSIAKDGTPVPTGPSATQAPSSQDPSSGNSNSTKSSTNTGAIVGGVVGGLVLLAILLVVALRLKRKNHHVTASEPVEIKIDSGNVINVGSFYKIIQTHESVLDDELSVHPGDIVQVHAIYDDGWVNASIKSVSGSNKSLDMEQRPLPNELVVGAAEPRRNPTKSSSIGMQGMVPAACLGSHVVSDKRRL